MYPRANPQPTPRCVPYVSGYTEAQVLWHLSPVPGWGSVPRGRSSSTQRGTAPHQTLCSHSATQLDCACIDECLSHSNFGAQQLPASKRNGATAATQNYNSKKKTTTASTTAFLSPNGIQNTFVSKLRTSGSGAAVRDGMCLSNINGGGGQQCHQQGRATVGCARLTCSPQNSQSLPHSATLAIQLGCRGCTAVLSNCF